MRFSQFSKVSDYITIIVRKHSMSYININGQLIAEEAAALSLSNRGFQYADGLFETMIFQSGKIRFFEDHLERLLAGMERFYLVKEGLPRRETLRGQILSVVKANKLETARVKLYVCRQEGGLYAPQSRQSNWMISATAFQPAPSVKAKTVIAKAVYINPTALSPYKTISAAGYVLAGIERTQRKADEIILLNGTGHVVEAGAANLFWLKENVIYTPAISCGCIAGVMRKNVTLLLREQGYEVKEIITGPEHMLQADSVFTTNVSGISFLTNIEGHKIGIAEELAFLTEL